MCKKLPLLITVLSLAFGMGLAQTNPGFSVIAYYSGDSETIDHYEAGKLTHIIFSFGHLKNGLFHIDNAQDTATVKHLVALKKQYPQLKIMLSLGGWGGCEPCSDVFSTAEGRKRFARSFQVANDYFGTDGLDLDWEYPAIEGHPGHPYTPEDRSNFTELVVELRRVLGNQHELSFAAGGFQRFLDESVDWSAIMPLLNRVNIMSYDLVNGYATVTGHHTPLYRVLPGEQSTDHAVQYLLDLGIPAEKLVIGAAFYTRVWKDVPATNDGLYQSGEHTRGYPYKQYGIQLTTEKGWQYHYDEKAQAPYWYNAKEKQFATGDDIRSVQAKTKYAIDRRLGGIMFWELTLDKERGGLLDAISNTKQFNTF